MAQARQYCPFCNAAIDVPAAALETRRVTCPRCGETVPVQLDSNQPAVQESRPEPKANFDEGQRFKRSAVAWSNRRLAATVVAVMVLMAIAGLVFALLTQPSRRARDLSRAGTPEKSTPTVTFTPPAELPALGYLNANVEIVGAVHVARTLQEPGAASFLAPTGPGGNLGIERLQKWTGLKLEDFNDVLAGVSLSKELQLTIVAETSRPFVAHTVRQTVKEDAPADVEVKCPTAQTLLIGYPKEDTLRSQPADPPELSAGLLELIRERVDRAATFWLVGRSDNLGPTVTLFLGATLPRPAAKILPNVRAFALWGQCTEPMVVNASFEWIDAASAATFAKALERWSPSGVTITKAQEGSWVVVQARGSATQIQRMISDGATAPAK